MHYHIRNKKTNEECFVTDLSGHDEITWIITKLDHEPNYHHNLIDGKLIHNKELENRSNAEGRFNCLHKGDLMLLIEKIQKQLLLVLEENSILTKSINKLSSKVAKLELEKGVK